MIYYDCWFIINLTFTDLFEYQLNYFKLCFHYVSQLYPQLATPGGWFQGLVHTNSWQFIFIQHMIWHKCHQSTKVVLRFCTKSFDIMRMNSGNQISISILIHLYSHMGKYHGVPIQLFTERFSTATINSQDERALKRLQFAQLSV